MLQVGDKVPSYKLQDQDGNEHTEAELKGKTTLVYFYPKDNTPGCTAQACQLRDNLEDLKKDGVEVIGVSADSVKSHKGFAERFNLPFTILADEDKTLVQAFGAFGEKSMFGKKYMGITRSSFLIGPDATVLAVWPKVKPLHQVEDVREWLAAHK
jgi:peroxiredoxin Q/BCP